MEPNADVDVLVIGLGPAGASAAAIAAEAGCRVLAIDKKHAAGVPVQCAEFVPLPMSGHARAPGVRVQAITGMKTFLPSLAVTHTDFPGLMIDRAAFDAAIVDRATGAGADIVLETRLVELDVAAKRAALTGPRGEFTVIYEVLVAADGPTSKVAERLALPRLRTVNTRQYTVPLRRDHCDTDIWLCDDFPGGYAWLFPKGSVANLGLGADKRFASDLKTPLDALHRRLVDAGLIGAEILGRTGGLIPVGGLREHLVEGNIMFVGDAAGLTHPITGAGISAAVISGERAGMAAAAYLRDDATALDDFEDDIRDLFEETIKRAVERRRYLDQYWLTPRANEDGIMRRGWIAFEEYFAAAPRHNELKEECA